MKEKVLIVGAAEGQLSLVKECKKRGYEIIIVSIQGDYPCFKYADKVYYIDVRNKEEIFEAVKNDNITMVVSDQLDIAVPTVAYISEKLKLKSIGYDNAIKFQNKYIMRNEAKKLGVNVPNCYVAKNINEALCISNNMHFPLMMKPVDSQGSWGVVKLYNLDELKEYFNRSIKYSSSSEIILEEFIEGEEYIVDAFSVNGKCNNLIVGKSEYFNLRNSCVPTNRIFKSTIAANDLEKRILMLHKKLVEGFGLKFGMSHGEYIYNLETDKIYLCEVAARGGGVRISSEIIPLITNVCTEKLLLDYLENNNLSINIDNTIKWAGYICFALPEGTIQDVKGLDEVKKITGVVSVNINNLELGIKTKTIIDKTGRYGPIVFMAKSLDECRNIINHIKSYLSVTVKTNNGLENIIWI